LWLNLDATEAPSLFASDANEYVLASLAESDQESPPWLQDGNSNCHGAERREESPLDLVPATVDEEEILNRGEDGDDGELKDTFLYKMGGS
jgi:hypothetical protein